MGGCKTRRVIQQPGLGRGIGENRSVSGSKTDAGPTCFVIKQNVLYGFYVARVPLDIRTSVTRYNILQIPADSVQTLYDSFRLSPKTPNSIGMVNTKVATLPGIKHLLQRNGNLWDVFHKATIRWRAKEITDEFGCLALSHFVGRIKSSS